MLPRFSFNVNTTSPEIQVHAYYTHDTFTKYGAHLEYTFLDIVGYFGGILGLFMGASALSFVEIAYAFLRMTAIGILRKWRRIRQLRRVRFVKSPADIKE